MHSAIETKVVQSHGKVNSSQSENNEDSKAVSDSVNTRSSARARSENDADSESCLLNRSYISLYLHPVIVENLDKNENEGASEDDYNKDGDVDHDSSEGAIEFVAAVDLCGSDMETIAAEKRFERTNNGIVYEIVDSTNASNDLNAASRCKMHLCRVHYPVTTKSPISMIHVDEDNQMWIHKRREHLSQIYSLVLVSGRD
jgi:hypothetical protein